MPPWVHFANGIPETVCMQCFYWAAGGALPRDEMESEYVPAWAEPMEKSDES